MMPCRRSTRRRRARRIGEHGDAVRLGMARRRSEPSERYIAGMCDLLRVLFADGDAVAEACLEEAYALAIGVSPRFTHKQRNLH